MQIIVKTTTTVFVADVEPSDTIDAVKDKIHAEYEIPPNQQSLIFAGKRLKDGVLSDYEVKEFDMIICVTPRVVWARR